MLTGKLLSNRLLAKFQRPEQIDVDVAAPWPNEGKPPLLTTSGCRRDQDPRSLPEPATQTRGACISRTECRKRTPWSSQLPPQYRPA
jgi:hypothetical protein